MMKIHCLLFLFLIIILQDNKIDVKAEWTCAGKSESCRMLSCCSGLRCECKPSPALSCYCK
uniref:TxLP2 n=1 Tax=Lychas mucronatus TaxID=172552 RepID=A0A0U1SEA6_LYCMC|nr:TxLP2 [Lychas mucronatus]